MATMTTTVPQTGNIDDNSTINIGDAAPPTNTITGASYDPASGVVVTGTNFTTIAAMMLQDITSYMNWDNIWWDIDGDNDSTAEGAEIGADDFAFTVGEGGNVANTTIVSATQMTITLTDDGKTALHGTAGFAADGVTTDANDQIDILAGSAVTLPATLVLMMRLP